MTYKIGTPIRIIYNHGVTGATITYQVLDEIGGLFAGGSGSLTESVVKVGEYEGTFTPDAAGLWAVCILVGSTVYAMVYPVEFGLDVYILADTAELQTDWVNGGRLDLLIDGIKTGSDKVVSGGATEANVTTAVNDIAAVHTHVETIEADTNELQTDLHDGGRLDLILDDLDAEVDVIKASLGNPTNMGAVTQLETGTIAEYVKFHREVSRIKNQTRIGLVVPDYANIASDPDNLALYAQLQLVSVPNYIDQTGVDGGHQDWLPYDLIVIGSDKYAAFTVSNLDDLILLKVPILVCNSPVAAKLKMGTATSDGDLSVDEYCKLISHRVPMLEYGSTGDKTIFSPAATSDRLDMSDAQLVEDVMFTNAVGDSNTTTVLGWLSAANVAGTREKLDDNTDIPAGRVFGGCFNNADNLNTAGLALFRRVIRNLALSEMNADITLNANASKLFAIEADTNELQTDWVNDGRLDVLIDSIISAQIGGVDASNRVAGRAQMFPKTMDLHNAAGIYDIATATTQAVLVESLVVSSTLDLSDDAGFTGISIQSDNATPQIFISSVTGAKANLTELAQIAWTGAWYLGVGDKIRLTIIGDTAEVNPSNLVVTVKYRAVVNGGYLA